MKNPLAFVVAALCISLIAAPAHALTGKVVDKAGKPVPKATVRVMFNGSNREPIFTDSKGVFSYPTPTVNDSEKRWFSVLAYADGYAYARKQSELKNDTKVDLTLLPEKKIKGKVVDENGQPVEGAKVALERLSFQAEDSGISMDGWQGQASDGWSQPYVDTFSTDKNGGFVISHIPDPSSASYCNLSIEVTKDGRALINKTVDGSEMSAGLVITDPLECKLQGTVYAPDRSTPIGGGIGVAVPGTAGRSGFGNAALVDSDGKYTLSKLPPGQWNLIMVYRCPENDPRSKTAGLKPNWVLPAEMGIELLAGQTKTVDLTMVDGVLIKGKVVDSNTGKSFESASLSVQHPGRPTGTAPEYTGTARDGEFSIYVVPGMVDICPQAAGPRSEQVQFDRDQVTHTTFNAVRGEDKTDLVVKVDPNEGQVHGGHSKTSNPVLPDIELVPGTYELAWNADLIFPRYSHGRISYSGDKARSQMLKLPKINSKKAIYSASSFDEDSSSGLLMYIFDESRGTGKGFDKLYLDINRNRDLTDDQPIDIFMSGVSGSSPWLELPSHQGLANGEHASKPIRVRLQLYSQGGSVWVECRRKGAWKGTIETNKGKIECALFDSNFDGIYGSVPNDKGSDSAHPVMGDKIYVDLNGLGHVYMDSYSDYMSRQGVYLMEANPIAGKLYKIRTNKIGNKITISPYAGPTGTLLVKAVDAKRLQASIESMILMGKKSFYDLKDYDGGPVPLPIGDYKIRVCTMAFNQAEGKKIQLDCTTSEEPIIKNGKQTVVNLGGKPILRGLELNKNKIYLCTESSGAVAWDIHLGNNITVTRIGGTGDGQSYHPKATFFDKSGKNVHTMAARYT